MCERKFIGVKGYWSGNNEEYWNKKHWLDGETNYRMSSYVKTLYNGQENDKLRKSEQVDYAEKFQVVRIDLEKIKLSELIKGSLEKDIKNVYDYMADRLAIQSDMSSNNAVMGDGLWPGYNQKGVLEDGIILKDYLLRSWKWKLKVCKDDLIFKSVYTMYAKVIFRKGGGWFWVINGFLCIQGSIIIDMKKEKYTREDWFYIDILGRINRDELHIDESFIIVKNQAIRDMENEDFVKKMEYEKVIEYKLDRGKSSRKLKMERINRNSVYESQNWISVKDNTLMYEKVKQVKGKLKLLKKEGNNQRKSNSDTKAEKLKDAYREKSMSIDEMRDFQDWGEIVMKEEFLSEFDFDNRKRKMEKCVEVKASVDNNNSEYEDSKNYWSVVEEFKDYFTIEDLNEIFTKTRKGKDMIKNMIEYSNSEGYNRFKE